MNRQFPTLYEYFFVCRFTLSVVACYTSPSVVCSQANTGYVNVLSNTCPVYNGDAEATISPDLASGSQAFSLNVYDPDVSDQLTYQIIGDEASVRDFTIDSQGIIRTQASYRDSSVSVYNMQIIVRDGSLNNPCFLPIYLRLSVQRNVNRPEFGNTSSIVTILETYAVDLEFITIRVGF